MRLKDKVAIITGGARGIGRSCAIAFGKEDAKLVIADINPATAEATVNTLRKEGIDALSIRTDISSPESTIEMARRTVEHFGRIDVLVNNAFTGPRFDARVPFYKIDLNEWDRVISVNLKGTFLCSRAVFPYMKDQGGKIINIASLAFFTGVPNMAHYVASKGGIIGLSRALARELGKYKINVNCIAPGSTFSEDPTDKEALKYREESIARRILKRVEYPDDLAGTAVFLASSDSDFISGQIIVVDGGEVMH